MPGLEGRAGEPPTAAALGHGRMEKGAGGAANGVEGEGVRDWIWDTCLYMMHVLCGPLAGRPANFVPGRAICHAGVAARPHSGMVYGSCQPGHGDKRAVPCCAWAGPKYRAFQAGRCVAGHLAIYGEGGFSMPIFAVCHAVHSKPIHSHAPGPRHTANIFNFCPHIQIFLACVFLRTESQ